MPVFDGSPGVPAQDLFARERFFTFGVGTARVFPDAKMAPCWGIRQPLAADFHEKLGHRVLKCWQWIRACVAIGAVAMFATVTVLSEHTAGGASGITLERRDIPEVPWSIHIVRIPRTNAALSLESTLGGGVRFGGATVSEQLRRLPSAWGEPVASINGDYFVRNGTYVGDPEGVQIVRGELVSAPSEKAAFWLDAEGKPHLTNIVSQLTVKWPNGATVPIGLNEDRDSDRPVLYTSATGSSTRTYGGWEYVLQAVDGGEWLPLKPGSKYTARVRTVRKNGNAPVGPDSMILSVSRVISPRCPLLEVGAVIEISTETRPSLKGATVAIGGGPALVRGGKVTRFASEAVRHPRAAFGYNKEFYFFVTVDGRQRKLSVGMTLVELAEYMQRLGCDEAMNLDGGGSATLWFEGRVVNSPSEGAERDTGNTLVVVRRKSSAPTP